MYNKDASPQENKRTLYATVAATVVLLLWYFVYDMPMQDKRDQYKRDLAEYNSKKYESIMQELESEAGKELAPEDISSKLQYNSDGVIISGSSIDSKSLKTRNEQIAASPRIKINSPRLAGSLNLKGLRLDDLKIVGYKTELKGQEDVILLSPSSNLNQEFAIGMGWGGKGVTFPDSNTVWNADKQVLNAGDSVDLSWQSPEGVAFSVKLSLDQNYVFDANLTVTNSSGSTFAAIPYAFIKREYDTENTDANRSDMLTHRGPLGVFDEEFNEIAYSDVRDEGKMQFSDKKGWAGITDKYWLTSIIPTQGQNFNTDIKHSNKAGIDYYQTSVKYNNTLLASGETAKHNFKFYAGAKEITLIDQYAEDFNLPLFDRVVDFGWVYFLASPILKILKFIYEIVGNYGVAIVMLTLLVKLILFPLSYKSHKSMARLKELKPKLENIKARNPNDKQAMQKEMMQLYAREKVNPAGGCLPILLQIPVFFALFRVLGVAIELRHAPGFAWIDDLSAPDPTSWVNLFGALPFESPSIIAIGLWPILTSVSMYLQQKSNSAQVSDPIQKKVFAWMPWIFLILFAGFAAGLVIYWTFSNVFTLIQQQVITRRMAKKAA